MNILSWLLLFLLTTIVVAYPRMALRKILEASEQSQISYPSINVPPVTPFGQPVIFPDADHPFQEAGDTDQRGICPGLNVLANYGYLPRNGIASLQQLVWAQMEVFGFCYDFAAFISTIGVALSGDITTQLMSIGGPDERTSGPLSCLLSLTPGGLNALHKSDVDGSLRADDGWFHNGDPTVFNGTRWGQLRAIADCVSNGKWNDTAIRAMRDWAFKYSVENNPYFLWSPMELLFYAGEELCWYSIPSAGADGNPIDALYEYIAIFFGITQNDDGSYNFDNGTGILPPSPDGNWYRRSTPLCLSTIVTSATEAYLNGKPYIHVFGGNQGQVNTYTPDPTQLSLGTPNATACLLYSFVFSLLPSSTNSLLLNIVNWVDYVLFPIFQPFGCVDYVLLH